MGTVVGQVGRDWNRYGGVGAVEQVRVGLTAKCGAMTREVGMVAWGCGEMGLGRTKGGLSSGRDKLGQEETRDEMSGHGLVVLRVGLSKRRVVERVGQA